MLNGKLDSSLNLKKKPLAKKMKKKRLQPYTYAISGLPTKTKTIPVSTISSSINSSATSPTTEKVEEEDSKNNNSEIMSDSVLIDKNAVLEEMAKKYNIDLKRSNIIKEVKNFSKKMQQGSPKKFKQALHYKVHGKAGENDEVKMTYALNKNLVPEIVKLTIKPELIAKNDVTLVESLLASALNDIFQKELPKMNKIFE